MITVSRFQRNQGKRSAGIAEIFYTASAAGYSELETKSDTIQWSVNKTKSPNEGIDIVAAFLVGFRGKQK